MWAEDDGSACERIGGGVWARTARSTHATETGTPSVSSLASVFACARRALRLEQERRWWWTEERGFNVKIDKFLRAVKNHCTPTGEADSLSCVRACVRACCWVLGAGCWVKIRELLTEGHPRFDDDGLQRIGCAVRPVRRRRPIHLDPC